MIKSIKNIIGWVFNRSILALLVVTAILFYDFHSSMTTSADFKTNAADTLLYTGYDSCKGLCSKGYTSLTQFVDSFKTKTQGVLDGEQVFPDGSCPQDSLEQGDDGPFDEIPEDADDSVSEGPIPTYDELPVYEDGSIFEQVPFYEIN